MKLISALQYFISNSFSEIAETLSAMLREIVFSHIIAGLRYSLTKFSKAIKKTGLDECPGLAKN